MIKTYRDLMSVSPSSFKNGDVIEVKWNKIVSQKGS